MIQSRPLLISTFPLLSSIVRAAADVANETEGKKMPKLSAAYKPNVIFLPKLSAAYKPSVVRVIETRVICTRVPELESGKARKDQKAGIVLG